MRSGARGFTLLEVVIALAVFSLAALALASVLFSTSRLNESNREKTLVENAVRTAVEQMRNEEFAEIFRRYNDDPNDDPEGPGTAAGPDFAVPGLQAVEGDADGRPGQVEFPMEGTELREDASDPELQMPRDLNADGIVDDQNHAGDYRILPVTVRVEWRGIGGDRRHIVRTVFVPK